MNIEPSFQRSQHIQFHYMNSFLSLLMDAFVEEEKSSNETTDVVTFTLRHYKSNSSKTCLPIFKNQNSKEVRTFFLRHWLVLRSLTLWVPLKSWHIPDPGIYIYSFLFVVFLYGCQNFNDALCFLKWKGLSCHSQG